MRTYLNRGSLAIVCKSQYVAAGELVCMDTGRICNNCRQPAKLELVARARIGFVGKEQARVELGL
jgi:hypothetical protein